MPPLGTRPTFTLLVLLAAFVSSCHRSHDDENRAAPIVGDDLQQRAKGLFAAIVADDPSLAEPFWFPHDPFIPLKDVHDPEAYWSTLHDAYVRDVHREHAARPSWDGATFDRLDVGEPIRWMAPGDEYNNVGYYRSQVSRLRYRVGDTEGTILVDTIITWQGRWFVTHLHRVRK